MGIQYIQQPNGKWARYSTMSDELFSLDCTEEELIEVSAREAYERAREETKKYLERRKRGEITQFSVTWEQAVENTRENCDDEDWLQEVGRAEKVEDLK